MQSNFFSQIISILKTEDKKKFIFIIFLILINTILEVFSLGLILPLISIISNNNFIFENEYVFFIYQLFNFSNTTTFILFFCFFLLFFFLIKTLLLLFISFKLIRFSNYLNYHFTSRLFKIYLYQPFLFFLNKNSSELIRNLRDEVGRAVNGVIKSLAEMIADSVLLLSILSFLFVVEPFATTFAILFFLSMGLFYYFITKKMLFAWGNERLELESKRYKNLMQSFTGIKEIMLTDTQRKFSENYNKTSKKSIYIDGNSNFVTTLPRNLFELFTIFAFVLIMTNYILIGKNVEDSISILGLFAFAAFKILPSSNKILNCFQKIKYHLPSFYLIQKELKREDLSLKINTNNNIFFNRDIKFQNLSFKYHNTENYIFEKLNININKNDMIGIIGESGSGKSTFINLLCGLIEPNDGNILIDNKNNVLNSKSWHNKVGIIPQDIFLFDDTIQNNIVFRHDKKMINKKNLHDSISISNLSEFIEKLDSGLNTIVGERGLRISGGQKQRIGIARVLYNNPDIIILDEATSNLDENNENLIIQSINKMKGKKTIIIITHKLSTIKNCDKVYELKNKKLNLKIYE